MGKYPHVAPAANSSPERFEIWYWKCAEPIEAQLTSAAIGDAKNIAATNAATR